MICLFQITKNTEKPESGICGKAIATQGDLNKRVKNMTNYTFRENDTSAINVITALR